MIRKLLFGGLAAILIGLGVATLLFGMQLPELPSTITGKISADLPPPNITPPRQTLEWKPRTNSTNRTRSNTNGEETLAPVTPPRSGGSGGGSSGGSGGGGSGSGSGGNNDDQEMVILTVRVANVTQLAGAQFEMHYSGETTRLRSITEGPFLDGGSTSNAMLINTQLDTRTGQLVAIFRTASGGVNGSGILMTAAFSTTNRGDITVVSPILSNSNTQPIPTSAFSWSVQ